MAEVIADSIRLKRLRDPNRSESAYTATVGDRHFRVWRFGPEDSWTVEEWDGDNVYNGTERIALADDLAKVRVAIAARLKGKSNEEIFRLIMWRP